MSQSQQVPEMNGEQAQQVLAETVHAPVFFNKLAEDYGIVRKTSKKLYSCWT